MRLLKTNLSFGEMCRLNSLLVEGKIPQTVIDEELAALIYDKLLKSTRTKKSVSISSIESIVKNQCGQICFDTPRRMNIVTTIKARPFANYIRFDNDNGGGLNAKYKTTWYQIVE